MEQVNPILPNHKVMHVHDGTASRALSDGPGTTDAVLAVVRECRPEYADLFAEHKITLATITHLDREALRRMGVKPVGDQIALLKALNAADPQTEKENWEAAYVLHKGRMHRRVAADV